MYGDVNLCDVTIRSLQHRACSKIDSPRSYDTGPEPNEVTVLSPSPFDFEVYLNLTIMREITELSTEWLDETGASWYEIYLG